jgi:hypothetical protein
MLPGMFGPAGGIEASSTMREVIHALGLTSGLKLILDAGDNASVASASQTKWLDVSGNGYDFNRGASSSSSSDDPTFTGTVGGRSSSDYYSFDGGDFFAYDSANEAWMDNPGQNSALFTMAGWAYLTADQKGLAGNITQDTTRSCWNLAVTSASKLYFSVFNTSLTAVALTSSASFPLSAWTFFAVSINESAGTGFMQVNGTQEAKTTTYTSPLSPGSDVVMQVGGNGFSGQELAAGSRFGAFMAWDGINLSTSQAASLFQATRGKYGI